MFFRVISVIDRLPRALDRVTNSGSTEIDIGHGSECRLMAVRPEGANHQWRRNPPRELSIDLVADERLGRVTGRAGAS